jgi:hypothetical protein
MAHRCELHSYAVLEAQLLAACWAVRGCVWLLHEVLRLRGLTGHPERLEMIGVPWCTGRNDDDEYAVVARLTKRGCSELCSRVPIASIVKTEGGQKVQTGHAVAANGC